MKSLAMSFILFYHFNNFRFSLHSKMSIGYQADWAADILAGRGVEAKTNFDENSFCHEFSLTDSKVIESSKVELLAGRIVGSNWLFGPASTLDTKMVIYPCNRFRCKIPCPCQICQHLPPTCKLPESSPCNCSFCSRQFRDHTQFHRTLHTKCKFCLQLVNIFPVFNFWFLNNSKRVLMYYESSREHFQVKSLVVNCEPPAKQRNPNGAPVYRNYDYYYKTVKSGLERFGWMTCEECDYSVRSIEQFREHIELNHLVSKRFFHCYINTVKDQGFKCYQCPAIFETKKELTRHVMKEHFYEKTYDCESCSEVFTREDNLIRHKKVVHIGKDSKFTCQDCGKNFTRKDALIRHKTSIHATDAIDILCVKCNATFNRDSNFERHKKSVMNQDGSFKNYCSDCDEHFCTGKLLTKHQNKKHVKFSCEDCDQPFTAKRSLQLHIKNRHFVSCKDCGAFLCNLNSLKQHRDSVHYLAK